MRRWVLAMLLGGCVVAEAQLISGELPRTLLPEPAAGVYWTQGCSRTLERRPSAIRRRPYDVLAYRLQLNWVELLTRTGTSPADRVFRGVNTIVVRIDSANVQAIVLDAAAMTIDTVTVNGIPIVPPPQPVGDALTIPLPSVPSPADTLTLRIAYTSRTSRNVGLYLYPKGYYVGRGPAGDSVVVEERIAYTMSEPEDARYWMPCNDAPYDKAQAEIRVLVPEGFEVASNGWLEERRQHPGGVWEYVWRDTVPIPTYLMSVTASRYAHWVEYYERPDGSRVPLWYYVWAPDVESSDSSGTRYNARYAFRSVPRMMQAYETYFGRYPFVKYGMAAVQPFAYGGMEHQTMTTINRSWLRGFAELGIAHELAHQWLGDLVSCATWNDIWLNEGGASWSEALWLEWAQGESAYLQRMRRFRDSYLEGMPGVMELPLYAPPMSQLFYYPTTYAKAAWVYHMLRRLLGDSLFFPALRNYMERHRYGSAETEDLLESLARDVPAPPVPWRTFFDQWVYSAGHPILEIVPSVSALDGNTYLVRCLLRQRQEGTAVPQVFVMPFVLRFFGRSGERFDYRVVTREREQWVELTLPFFPDSIGLNEEDVLCQVSVAPVSVREPVEGSGALLRVFPQPVVHEGTVEYTLPRSGQVALEVVDILGRRTLLYTSFGQQGRYRLPLHRAHWAAGVYQLRLWLDGECVATTLLQWQP